MQLLGKHFCLVHEICVIHTIYLFFWKDGCVVVCMIFVETVQRWGACHEPWFRSWWKGRGKGLRRRGTDYTSDPCIDSSKKTKTHGFLRGVITYNYSTRIFRTAPPPYMAQGGNGLHTNLCSSWSGLVSFAEVRSFWSRTGVGGPLNGSSHWIRVISTQAAQTTKCCPSYLTFWDI